MSKNQVQYRLKMVFMGIVFLGAVTSVQCGRAKNIILMFSDGAGFNCFDACSYYQYGQLGKQSYDQPGFIKYGCTHGTLNSR